MIQVAACEQDVAPQAAFWTLRFTRGELCGLCVWSGKSRAAERAQVRATLAFRDRSSSLFSITFPLSERISFVINNIPASSAFFHSGPLFSITFPLRPAKKEFFFLLPVRPTMDSRPAAPGQFIMKADEKIAFSGPHGLVVSRLGKGAEVADVPWNIRRASIRYNDSRRKGVCQALNSDLLRFRQWGERARLAGGRSGETRGIGRWSGGVLGRVAAVP